MPTPLRLDLARFPQDKSAVIDIFQEYLSSPSISLDFQDYEPELLSLPGQYAPPQGNLLLAWLGDALVGCAALRAVDQRRCELKRVYVRHIARGQSIGRALVERMLELARQAGYQRMHLDVLADFVAAQQLYASLGFVPAEAVSYNPIPGTQFLALDL